MNAAMDMLTRLDAVPMRLNIRFVGSKISIY